jgi:UDP-N-acetylenolpyruvoylglucosamine reductase
MVKFLTSVDMADHCTFGVHAIADFLVTISSEEELLELTQTLEWEKYPHILLG